MSASQLEPSCSSPSPVSTKVRRGEPSSFAAIAVPTATGRPWPSGPVFVSTPGTLLRSGWPLSGEPVGHEGRRARSYGEEARGRRASCRARRTRGPCSGCSGRAPGRRDARGRRRARRSRGWRGCPPPKVAADVAEARGVDHLDVATADRPGGCADLVRGWDERGVGLMPTGAPPSSSSVTSRCAASGSWRRLRLGQRVEVEAVQRARRSRASCGCSPAPPRPGPRGTGTGRAGSARSSRSGAAPGRTPASRSGGRCRPAGRRPTRASCR